MSSTRQPSKDAVLLYLGACADVSPFVECGAWTASTRHYVFTDGLPSSNYYAQYDTVAKLLCELEENMQALMWTEVTNKSIDVHCAEYTFSDGRRLTYFMNTTTESIVEGRAPPKLYDLMAAAETVYAHCYTPRSAGDVRQIASRMPKLLRVCCTPNCLGKWSEIAESVDMFFTPEVEIHEGKIRHWFCNCDDDCYIADRA